MPPLMPRRSNRLKKMSSEEKNVSMSEKSLSESDNEKTIMQHDTIAELKEEMKTLKLSVETLIKNLSGTPSSSVAETYTPPTTTLPQIIMPPTTPLQADTNKISIPTSYFKTDILPHYHDPLLTQNTYTPMSQPTYTYPYFKTCTPSQPMYNQSHLPTPLLSHPTQPCITSTTGQPTVGSQQVTIEQQQPFRKLYDLPEFNGLPEQWPMFAVSYRETTQRYNYTNMENLFRLQKALKGNAKTKVEAYLIHPESVVKL